MFEVVGKNKLKTNFIIVFFFLLVAAVVYVFCEYSGLGLGYAAIPIALIIAIASTFGSYYYSDRIILGISHARPADQDEDKQLRNSLEGLCLAAGMPMPRLYIIDDSAPNAFATGRNPEHAVICVTTGLLRKLDSYELEAVLGHELAHIKNYDILLSAVATIMVGIITLLADWFFRIGFRSKRSSNNKASVIIAIVGLILMIFAPIIGQIMKFALSRNREFLADSMSVEFCRNPDALAQALLKISSDNEPLESANKATANMYIVSPFKGGAVKNLFSTHPSIEKRIEAIKTIH